MRKKIIIALVVLMLGTSLLLAACAEPAPEPVVFRVAEHSASTGIRADALNFFKECVEERTGGRALVEIYFSDTLVSEKESLVACEQGTCDIAFITPGKHIAEIPYWEAMDVVPIIPSLEKQEAMWWRILDEIPEFAADYENINQKVIGFHPKDPHTMYMVEPVDSIWNLEGKTIRVYCAADAKKIEVLGALPVSVPMAECYTAMQSGTIDGAFAALESGHRFKFHEVAKGVVVVDTQCSGGNVMSVNLDTLGKLSAADQQVFEDCGKEMTTFIVNSVASQLDGIRADIVDHGCTILDVPSEDQDKWNSDPRVLALADEWAEKMDAAPLMEKLKKLVAESLK